MDLKPAKVAATLVLVGPVNPAMFHPEWFKYNNLLKASEADAAEVRVVSQNISVFRTDWLEVDVRPERIQLRTQQEPYFPVLRDLAVGCLNCMPRVPFLQVGFNWESAYQLPNSEAYHKLGHTLAPKDPWGTDLKSPGMLAVAIQTERIDSYQGTKNYGVRPDLERSESYEVVITVNDHVTFEEDKPNTPALVLECIENYWEESWSSFEGVASHLIRGV